MEKKRTGDSECWSFFQGELLLREWSWGGTEGDVVSLGYSTPSFYVHVWIEMIPQSKGEEWWWRGEKGNFKNGVPCYQEGIGWESTDKTGLTLAIYALG